MTAHQDDRKAEVLLYFIFANVPTDNKTKSFKFYVPLKSKKQGSILTINSIMKAQEYCSERNSYGKRFAVYCFITP